MKISKVLLETVLPITIGALFIVGYFFITDKVFREPELEDCESCFPSNLDYLKNVILIMIPSSFYQMIIGRRILKRNENSFMLNIINSFVFAIFFIVIFVLINLYQRKIEWDFYPVIFLSIFFLGLFYSVLMKLCRKIFA
jgi:uncharacterized membrane protein YozB (DUF420 family)